MEIRSQIGGPGFCSSTDLIYLLDRLGHATRVVSKGVAYILHPDIDSVGPPPSSGWISYETQSAAFPVWDIPTKDAIMAGIDYAGSRQSLKSYCTNSSVSKCHRTCRMFSSLRIWLNDRRDRASERSVSLIPQQAVSTKRTDKEEFRGSSDIPSTFDELINKAVYPDGTAPQSPTCVQPRFIDVPRNRIDDFRVSVFSLQDRAKRQENKSLEVRRCFRDVGLF